jgi:hypothetical protein
LAHCGSDQAVTGFIQFAELPYFGDAHVSVADDVGSLEAVVLTLAGGLDAGTNGG